MAPRTTSLLTLVLLTACSSGGGAGVSGSADESSASQSGSTSLWERAKSLVSDNSKTVEMSALALMADAFTEEAASRNTDGKQYTNSVLMLYKGTRQAMADRLETTLTEEARPLYTKLQKEGKKPPSRFTADHLMYSIPLVIALTPRKGWEVRPMRSQSDYDPELHGLYMGMLATSAIYANDVFGIISTELGGVTLNDPVAAKKRIIEIYNNIPPTQLKALLAAANDKVRRGNYSTDLTNSGNIHFVHQSAGDFVADARGVTWTKAGGVWFGDSRINGQQITFRLASTVSLQQRQTESGTNSQNSDAKVNGSGNVGPR